MGRDRTSIGWFTPQMKEARSRDVGVGTGAAGVSLHCFARCSSGELDGMWAVGPCTEPTWEASIASSGFLP